MKNKLDFKSFLNNLQATNRHLRFYVDWQKCLKNKFIWISKGWLNAKNKFVQAYEKIEIYNLYNINDFILKVKNV
ncbi:type II restriction endonuclease [Campylobacter sp. VicNov18]|uniref:hypothetical protein n=1 Tax=Campylobacter bilis TaxID=2691918 RepID=UPI00130E4F94|nr:hypothetical protein [Campylobacter bilis]MPV63789.1 hypothetical protein [Campylobacter hepaticus]MBM0637290.1 hypothetical protein [Campylobacter bilis]MCC8278009.1 type II restriction endonuclease [Campylobacter bilis]MCC8299513.1 type II restriction endonuclease [Campylobacter bilis]MCC8300918.1 type II restriction endonuclease [Campylobacter bilis]